MERLQLKLTRVREKARSKIQDKKKLVCCTLASSRQKQDFCDHPEIWTFLTGLPYDKIQC